MKITSPAITSTARTSVAGSRTDGVTRASASSPSSSKGAVDLSSTARHLSNLQNSDGDINVARVNEIRDALASGQLKIDPSRIADGLIASVRDLLK
ncbi:flagellar biosynthesis anti-sigma factor FlgM [Pollutimonas nitritireducens]|uniref:Negative regulator of flagellin synthesis n=1 Tax=Pollutimonas nitritireducens TaxID=2045209 RepID=A0A2N4UB17_9BURK|nr:flagellar biosynthesis anti-sigma factor FlgM [Pollutimonas nitritireducens]PLC52214.1 flagellar biosynthesis anti-sigma factor FlgM [Pollutimonas nitritireducens]